MTIRYKLLLFFFVQHFIFFIIALALYEFFVLPHTLKLETQSAQEKARQINYVFQSEIEHLDLLNKDWSIWDDTYAFVQDNNEAFRKSNLIPSLLDDIQLNTMAFFNKENKRVEIEDDGLISRASFMTDKGSLKKIYIDWKQMHHSGVVDFGNHIGILSIRNIFPSDGTDNSLSQGSLMMIRALDQQMMQRLNNSVNTTLVFGDNPNLFHYQGENLYLMELSETEMKIGLYIQGFSEDKGVFVTTQLPRYHFIANNNLMLTLLSIGVIFGVMSLLFSFYFLRAGVVQPLKALGGHIIKIRESESFLPSHLSKRDDEIGLLANEFNHLIESINTKNKLLDKVARIDALTGVANRMDLNEHFEMELKESCRNRVDLSILMLDIDYFKKYNDTYGHVKGDNVLKQVAQAIKDAGLRPRDYVARYGGEEFFILLPKTYVDGSVVVAKRIIENVAAMQIEHSSTLLYKGIISVSIGCYTLTAKKGDTVENVIAKADEALYTAKERGRNQYYVYRNVMT